MKPAPVGNHAKLNYYQPGALIWREYAVCDTKPTSDLTTLDAWTIVTDGTLDMSITYTPPVDAVAEVRAKMAAYHSVQLAPLQFAIYQDATSISWMTWKADHAATVEVKEWTTFPLELTRGTAYTFTLKYYVSNITLSFLGSAIYSYLSLMAWRKP